jgi:uncharacterized membrane protein
MSVAELAPATRPSLSLWLIGIGFIVAGMLHFIKPQPYVHIMPAWLPAPLLLVLISGALEILGGAGILLPATRVLAGWGLIALLVAVFPANVQMLLGAHQAHASRLYQAALVARLPLQGILIWWVWRAAVRWHG